MRGRRRVLLGVALAACVPPAGHVALAAFTGTAQRSATAQARQHFTPVLRSVPDIGGSPQTGGQLTVSSPGHFDYTPTGYGYQWLSCLASVCANATGSGATTTTYTPDVADEGRTLRVEVVATRGTASAAAVRSAATDTSQSTIDGRPDNTTMPSFDVAGAVYTVTSGTWTGSLTWSFRFEWLRCDATGAACTTVVRDTGFVAAGTDSYARTAADAGARLRVRVHARTATGATAWVLTSDSAIVP